MSPRLPPDGFDPLLSAVSDGYYVVQKDGARFREWYRLVAGSNIAFTPDVGAHELLISSSASGGGGSSYVGCSAIRSTTLTVTSAGVAIPFDVADEWDTNAIHDPATNNTRFTIPAGMTGFWSFAGHLSWPISAIARRLGWALNGTQLGTGYFTQIVSGNGGFNQSMSVDLKLTAGDYVECIALAGSTTSISSARATCRYLGA